MLGDRDPPDGLIAADLQPELAADRDRVVGPPRCRREPTADRGVTLGPLRGRLIAQELLDGASTDLLEPYRPAR